MIFVGFITFAIPSKAAEDPLVRRREDRDRAERAAREDRDRAERAAREAAMEEVRTWIIDKLKEATENGRRTAPTISTLLDTLRSELDLHRPDPDPFDTCGIKTREVDRLRALYVGWEPVYRWRGVNTATSLGRDPPGLGGNPSLGRYASLSRNAGLGRDTGLGRDADSGGNPGLGRNPSLGRYASLSRNAGLGRDAGSGGDAGLGGDAAPLSGHHGTGVIQPEDPHPASGSDSWRPEHTRTCEQQ
ncbi:MAG: hypothetical protein M1839_007616 [Geoglossum umbratile]|nr:MAG: hypothetical protein M1839_007616 [Geoglossum umbratile]